MGHEPAMHQATGKKATTILKDINLIVYLLCSLGLTVILKLTLRKSLTPHL